MFVAICLIALCSSFNLPRLEMPIDAWSDTATETVGSHVLIIITMDQAKVTQAIEEIALCVPGHYIDPNSVAHTLARLGKAAAAQKLRVKFPQSVKIRSGDLGEILATEYIEQKTGYEVPIRKLRWHDHREMAMRGDDVIGIKIDGGRIHFLKTEAKSRKTLGTAVITEAREGLDGSDGRPAPHALAFVADRLREIGKVALADDIESAQLVDGISDTQIEHLLFTFSGNNPKALQKAGLGTYTKTIKQYAVGLMNEEHQQFIADVYQKVEDGIDG